MAVICVSEADVNRFIVPPLVVNLWHGVTIKKLYADRRPLTDGRETPTWRSRVNAMLAPRYTQFFLAASSLEARRMASAFQTPVNQIFVSGYPRTDSISVQAPRDPLRSLLYMPTFRRTAGFSPEQFLVDSEKEVSAFLNTHSVELLYKPHVHAARGRKGRSAPSIEGPIRFVAEGPLVEPTDLLWQSDILITDYSSIMFDFLLTGKPIIFAPFDLENYVKDEGGFYSDYESFVPGPLCKDWSEVLHWVTLFRENPNLYSEERKRVLEVSYEFPRGNSSKTVSDQMKKILRNQL